MKKYGIKRLRKRRQQKAKKALKLKARLRRITTDVERKTNQFLRSQSKNLAKEVDKAMNEYRQSASNMPKWDGGDR
jgi:vacuolar-type H+-ATPase subunit H